MKGRVVEILTQTKSENIKIPCEKVLSAADLKLRQSENVKSRHEKCKRLLRNLSFMFSYIQEIHNESFTDVYIFQIIQVIFLHSFIMYKTLQRTQRHPLNWCLFTQPKLNKCSPTDETEIVGI